MRSCPRRCGHCQIHGHPSNCNESRAIQFHREGRDVVNEMRISLRLVDGCQCFRERHLEFISKMLSFFKFLHANELPYQSLPDWRQCHGPRPRLAPRRIRVNHSSACVSRFILREAFDASRIPFSCSYFVEGPLSNRPSEFI